MGAFPASHQRTIAVALTAFLSFTGMPVECGGQQQSDSADVVATVAAFHSALGRGDSTAALALLARDAVILEAGGIETRDEYRAHHLPADIAFARGVPGVTGPVQVTVIGDVAWTSSTSTAAGTFEDRRIDSQGAELVVLSRTADGWRIRAIHWSSRARREG